MSGEPMALKVINKINGKLKSLYWQNKFLTPELRRTLIQRLFSHILTTRAQLGTQILPKKQKRRYKLFKKIYIQFCLKLHKMEHISPTELGLIYWLPAKERVHQFINA